jgi:Uma2 family endonuclease
LTTSSASSHSRADEVHTPDSSRFWLKGSYDERHVRGEEPESLDKEFLRLWRREKGIGFDSSTGFALPNGTRLSPDLAWIRKERWEQLDPEQREQFPPLCPHFVVELRSRTDDLEMLKEKMGEYIECGTRLGWLIDPYGKSVYIYRPGAVVEHLETPASVLGEPELAGL